MINITSRKIFLSAQWQYLAMLNYIIPKEILIPHLPPQTELDLYNGEAMASIVGFLFKNTKVLGVKWPLHTHFEEVNLRFYIKHFDGTQWKRGVAFISEIVPKPIISLMANKLYNEPYQTMKMNHNIHQDKNTITAEYQWKSKTQWNTLKVTAQNKPTLILPNTPEDFIFEHYWGYNKLKNDTTIEYAVEHPRWEVYPVQYYNLDCNIKEIYGPTFTPYLTTNPTSVFLAKGSEIIVRKPTKLKL